MQKDEDITKSQADLNFESNDELGKGVFVKKKANIVVEGGSPNTFLFNFPHLSDNDLADISIEISNVEIK